MTSSSRKKRRTTGWSSAIALALSAGLAGAACSRPREVFVTYFNGDHAVSLRHPASWRTDQAEQDGVWYRYFLAPPLAAQNRSPVSVTLLAGPATATLDEYAERYLAAHALSSTGNEQRQGVKGKSWVFAATDGSTRHRLLLLEPGAEVVGLYVQGDAAAYEKQAGAVEEIWSSLRFEKPELYPRREWSGHGVSLGIPDSWRETRSFSGGGTLLAQFVSPALATDKGAGTVHASLSLTLEPLPEGGGLEAYHQSSRQRLGDNFRLVSHASFKGGLVDVMRTETPLTMSYVKRFYFAEAGRGASLSFEARDDVFPRASRWADFIASTLRFGGKTGGAP